MRTSLMTIGIAMMVGCLPVAAMTDAECAAAWTAADTNNDGTIGVGEGTRYFAALRVANVPITDEKMTRAVFDTHCKAGLFNAAKVEAGAPLAGSNSFTEAQAMDRATAAGFSKVSPLVKDGDGIWRGTAMSGDKSVKIGVDYKGNVVSQ